MARDTVGIGIIGTGGIANVHAAGCRENSHAEVVGLADVNLEGARAFAARHGLDVPILADYNDLIALNGLDAVIICTPNDLHGPAALAAAAAKKHILCEKPLAIDVSTAEEMTAAARAARVRAMTGYSKRYFDEIRFLKSFMDSEGLGRIYHVRAFYLQSWLVSPATPRTWRLERSRTGSGALGDLGSHVTDLAQHLVGDIVRVTGMLSTFTPKRPPVGGGTKLVPVDVDDAAAFTAYFKNGAMGHFEVSRNATGHGDHWGIEINAERGSVRFDKDEMRIRLMVNEGPCRYAGWVDLPLPHAFRTPGNEFCAEINHFVDCIRNRRQPEPDFAEGLKVERVLDAIIKSSAKGVAVDVGG